MTSAIPATSEPPLRLFRADSVGESLGIYLPTTVAARFLGLVRGVVLAWLISEREFGLLQIALLVTNVLQPLCGVGLSEAVARYVPQHETRGTLRPYLARMVPFSIATAAVLSAVVYLAAEPLGRLLFTPSPGGAGGAPDGASTTLSRLAAVTTFALIGYFLLLSILKGLRMFRAVSLLELVHHAGFTVLTVGIALGGWTSAGAMLACYTATLAGAILLFAPPLRRVLRQIERPPAADATDAAAARGRPLIRQMLRFSLWAGLAAVMWQTLQYYPIWYLHKMCGEQGELTAVFGGMRLMTQVVLIGAIAVITVVQTSVTKTWESRGPAEADRQWRLAFKSTALIGLIGCGIIAAGSGAVVHLFPRGYAHGAAIVPLSLLFFLVCGHLSFLAIHFNLIEKTGYLFGPWVVGVASNVAFGKWMVQPGLEPTAALRAAAWSGVLAVTAALVANLCLRRAEKRPLDAGSWILLALTYSLALPMYVMGLAIAAATVLAISTHVVLSATEKRQLAAQVAAARRKVAGLLRHATRAPSSGPASPGR